VNDINSGFGYKYNVCSTLLW